jgi:anti-sigma regulatory factor (Ser/Thr protein kinase)
MDKPFRLKFTATRESLMKAENELRSFFVAESVAELDALGVHLAFHEHCVNIIEHGLAGAGGKKITDIVASIDVSTDGCFMNAVLTIEDATPLFDPMTAAQNDGLGLSLIKAVSGSIKWENREGKNICTFVFPKLQKKTEKSLSPFGDSETS